MRTLFTRTALSTTFLLAAACGVEDLKEETPGGGGGGVAGPVELEPAGDPLPVEPAVATETVTQNLTNHVTEIDSSLDFLEASDVLSELLGLFGGDEDESTMPMGPDGEMMEPEEEEEEEERLEIELDEVLDDLIEVMEERLMVASTIEPGEDDLSVTYLLDPEFICAEDEPERSGPETTTGPTDGMGEPHDGQEGPDGDDGDRDGEHEGDDRDGDHEGDDRDGDHEGDHRDGEDEDDDDCERIFTDTPVRIMVTSHEAGDMDLSVLVGPERLKVLVVLLHADRIALQVDLEALKGAAVLIIDEEDVGDLPDVVEGTLRVEVRREGPKVFTAEVSVPSDIRIANEGPDPMSLRFGAAAGVVTATIDGMQEVLSLALGVGEIDVTVPWQMIVDLFHSDEPEGHDVCESDEQGNEHCWWEEGEPEDPPQVEGPFNLFLAGVTASTSFAADDDRLKLTGVGLGDDTTAVSVDGQDIVRIDLNKDTGRTLDLSLREVAGDQMRLELSPGLDLSVQMAMKHISDVYDDLPEFMIDETLGVRFDGSDTPALQSVGPEDERQMQVAAGQLTFWSTAMEDDVVIAEGMCMVGEDEDEGGDEFEEGGDDTGPSDGPEEDEGHEVFGGLHGETCGR